MLWRGAFRIIRDVMEGNESCEVDSAIAFENSGFMVRLLQGRRVSSSE